MIVTDDDLLLNDSFVRIFMERIIHWHYIVIPTHTFIP